MHSIAVTTSEDSKQMRSIAFLTMFFLPATFVAVSKRACRPFQILCTQSVFGHQSLPWLTHTIVSFLDGLL